MATYSDIEWAYHESRNTSDVPEQRPDTTDFLKHFKSITNTYPNESYELLGSDSYCWTIGELSKLWNVPYWFVESAVKSRTLKAFKVKNESRVWANHKGVYHIPDESRRQYEAMVGFTDVMKSRCYADLYG